MATQRLTTEVSEETRAIGACRHHWIIEPAGGPVSRGVCRICNEVRDFNNSFPGILSNEDLPWVHTGGNIPITASSDLHKELDDP